MASIFRISTVFALGLLSLNVGCSSDEQTANSEDSALSTEQACLRAHTEKGKFKFRGEKECQVCGASRKEFSASLDAGGVVALPQAKFGLSLDLSLVAVRLTDHIGGYIELNHIASGSSCGASQSWQFDDDKDPKAIKLCNCDSKLKVSAASYVDLLVGCKGEASGTATAVATTEPTKNTDPDQSAQGGSTSKSTSSKPATTTTTTTTPPATCSTGSCSAPTTCSTGTCSNGGGITIGGGIQIGGSIQIGGGAAASATTSAAPTTTTSAPTTSQATGAGQCNCLWNVLFAVGGCSQS
jgi:hypothetical protein